jgi:hypothetical protein
MTVSIKGPESSGKSTLMNLQYGTDFKSGTGKCTSGINGYIMRFEESFKNFENKILNRKSINLSFSGLNEMTHANINFGNYNFSSIHALSEKNPDNSKLFSKQKYILFLDSQGMLSQERDNDFDRKIGTFLLAISQVVLVNFIGDFTLKFKELLEVTNYTYMSLNLGKHCMFRRNKPKVSNKNMIVDGKQILL